MFSLFYGLYEYMTRKEEFHILIIGLDMAGKTTVLERLKTLYTDYSGLEPTQILPTVGLNIARFETKNIPLVFWDLGGQASLRSIWEKYYADTHAILFVVDASQIERIEEAKAVLDRTLGNTDLLGAPLLVIANKQDETGAVGGVELKERLGRVCDVQPTSALTGDGLQSAIEWVIAHVKHSKRTEFLRGKIGM